MAVAHYQQLIAWQKAMDLAAAVHACTRAIPRDELYGLTSQLRRCAVSIPSNSAEGQGRGSVNEFRHFLRTAMGSLQECETQLLLAERFAYIDAPAAQPLRDLVVEVGRITHGLIPSLDR